MNTVFVHKLKQEGIEIALLVSHWLIFLFPQVGAFAEKFAVGQGF